MGGYASGGDANYNTTSTNQSSRLGGNDGPHLTTPAEIAVIVATLVIFIVALLLVLYCRKLQARRDLDLENKARVMLSTTPTTPPAAGTESIELKDGFGPTAEAPPSIIMGHHTTTPSIESRPLTLNIPSTKAPPEKQEADKQPLWRYIHWKDPYNTPLPRVQPRHEVTDIIQWNLTNP
ncbi:hypothetical protein B0H66DRAFT_528357 [Apodospora peruviana]|uniref:Uncharacterized protein n=1 Tax=Apodospora peruviana TaxID=516989 RepID=A0AAE0MFW8_9PEZI|nr:hypothetical protein B0H66DRAFT_528357 [Apodospora peruviana]